MAHKWTGAKALRRHGHGGDEYVEQDEEFEPTDAELHAFADSITEVGDSGPKCADENCSRTVDEEGDRCWQHGEDEG